jgi:hypothetical protein
MASDSERLVKDWQAVLKQAKQMELLLEKFVSTFCVYSNYFHAFPALQVFREPQSGGRFSIG